MNVRKDPPRDGTGDKGPGDGRTETTPAEERGERLETAKTIARGGKAEGPVPGAEPSHQKDGDR